MITDRINKELITTVGGLNVPPVIKDTVKGELPLLSIVIVVGGRRKVLAAVVTLRVTDAHADEKIKAYLDAGLKRANARATLGAQTTTFRSRQQS
ncbi:unnamed protein product [Peronospora belbahrii]|uniref:Uncharacterized protein n=1 Tax=Peronospora belbahrii TaxID=622444 RepID=A0AAU9KRY2_9STRA|nr:unnamed protein product [Peronospora belbahrii]